MISPVRLVAGAAGVGGGAVALAAGYLVVRGPFLGDAMLAPRSLLVTICAFVVAVGVAAWGATRYARA